MGTMNCVLNAARCKKPGGDPSMVRNGGPALLVPTEGAWAGKPGANGMPAGTFVGGLGSSAPGDPVTKPGAPRAIRSGELAGPPPAPGGDSGLGAATGPRINPGGRCGKANTDRKSTRLNSSHL